MGKRTRTFEIKHASVLRTLVFETVGEPEGRVEFRYRDLKRWGYDLLSGLRDGREAFFLAEVEDERRKDDVYEEDGARFEVHAVHDALPKDTRLIGVITMQEGTAWLDLSLEGATEEAALARIPAAELLLYYLSKEGLFDLLGALRNVGEFVELERSRGQEGKAQPFSALPAAFRQFVRDARKLEREMGAGRITLAYFGENKERKRRYRATWLVPTIAVFDYDKAEKINQLLGALG